MQIGRACKIVYKMDAVREALAGYGNAWNSDIPKTLTQLFGPLLAEQNKKYGDEIKAEKALKYGPDSRNRIDVYSPAAGASGRPVVLYIHGGGLVAGDNDVNPHMYANIGKMAPGPDVPWPTVPIGHV